MLIRARVHPFPSRTRKLSSLLPTILGWRRPGKIGSANIKAQHASVEPFPFSTSKKAEASKLATRRVSRFAAPVRGCKSGTLLSDALAFICHRQRRGIRLPTILGWRRPGKIGSANTKDTRKGVFCYSLYFIYGKLRCDMVSCYKS